MAAPKKKIYYNKKEFEKANKAYQDSTTLSKQNSTLFDKDMLNLKMGDTLKYYEKSFNDYYTWKKDINKNEKVEYNINDTVDTKIKPEKYLYTWGEEWRIKPYYDYNKNSLKIIPTTNETIEPSIDEINKVKKIFPGTNQAFIDKTISKAKKDSGQVGRNIRKTYSDNELAQFKIKTKPSNLHTQIDYADHPDIYPYYTEPTTEPVYKDPKTSYSASKYLQLKGKPSGYINEGNKTGRKEFKKGGWLDGLDNSSLNFKEFNNNPLVQTAKIFDPTGVSSYPDVYYAGEDFYNNPSLKNAANLGINIFGALPMIGKLAMPAKLARVAAKTTNKAAGISKGVNAAIDTAPEIIPFLRKPTEVIQDFTSKNFVQPFTNSIKGGGKSYKAEKINKINNNVDRINLTNNLSDVYSSVSSLTNKKKKAEGGWLDGLEGSQILPKDSTQYNNAYNSPANQGRVGFTTEKDYLNNWFSSQRFKDKIGTADPNSVSNEAVNKVKTSKLFYNPNDTKGSIENYVDMHTNTTSQDKKELLKHKAVGKSYKDSNDAIITKVEGQNNPNSISIHELTHLTNLDELTKSKFKPALYQDKYGTTRPFNRTEAYPALMQFRYDNNFKPDQVITPEDMKNIRSKGYKNILDDKYTDDEILNYLNTVADNSKGNPNQMAKGGFISTPQDNTTVKVQKPDYKIAKTKQELFLHDRNKRLNQLEDHPETYNVRNDYSKLKINEPGLEKPEMDPIDFIGLGEIKGAINLSKNIYQGNKIRKMMSPIDDVLTKPKFTPPDYIEPNISKITRPYIDKEEDIMERFTGSTKGIEKRTKYYTKETAPNYEQLEQMRKTRNYENVPDINNVKQSGFIDSKSILQKYPKGPLTQKEIEAYKNSHYYKTQTKEHLDLKNKYGDQWKLPNHAEEYLQKAIETGDRDYINKVLYGGRNWKTSDYAIAGLIGTAYPAYTGIMGLAFSPPAVKNKVLNKAGITTKPNVLTSRDTTIDITNMPMDFAKVNETKNGKAIIGGEFIEDSNNTVRKAKDWLSATDTYSDKNYPSKDIKSFYGIENGKFKVGKADEFKPETEIVPRRFGDININKAVMNGKEMRLLDKDNKPIYQNTPNTGKFILYSPSTKNSQFVYINTGKNGVNKVNDFLKKNKDAQYIHLDNGRYEYYGVNKEGLTEQDFKNYYEQDLKRKGNPGYNLIIKSNGGWLDNLK